MTQAADDAYANAAHIPDGDGYFARWEAAAGTFREGHKLKELGLSYGVEPRQTYDIFHPERSSRGTVVFIHGGYWKEGSPRLFSHLAAGAVAAGHACAMPSYTLAPDARIGDITGEIAAAIGAIAHRTVGPLYLVGHSAGGHLVARMACVDQVADWSARVARTLPVSPLSDLAPLMDTAMNDTLRMDGDEAQSESPVHHERQEIPVTVWVGGAERPAFLDQAQWLAERWDCALAVDAGKHHFDVIEGLEKHDSPMMRALLS